MPCDGCGVTTGTFSLERSGLCAGTPTRLFCWVRRKFHAASASPAAVVRTGQGRQVDVTPAHINDVEQGAARSQDRVLHRTLNAIEVRAGRLPAGLVDAALMDDQPGPHHVIVIVLNRLKLADVRIHTLPIQLVLQFAEPGLILRPAGLNRLLDRIKPLIHPGQVSCLSCSLLRCSVRDIECQTDDL